MVLKDFWQFYIIQTKKNPVALRLHYDCQTVCFIRHCSINMIKTRYNGFQYFSKLIHAILQIKQDRLTLKLVAEFLKQWDNNRKNTIQNRKSLPSRPS